MPVAYNSSSSNPSRRAPGSDSAAASGSAAGAVISDRAWSARSTSGRLRCARGLASLYAQANQFNLQQAKAFQVEWTPRGWMRPDLDLLGFEQQLYLRQPSIWETGASEHAAILDACRERDPDLVASRLARHLARHVITLILLIAPDREPALVRRAVRSVVRGEEPDPVFPSA